MNLEIRARGVELSDDLKEHIDRSFRFAITRFGERIQRVRVVLHDVNGPRGGEDIHCKVRVNLVGPGEVIVDEISLDPFVAVARASERVSQSIARRLARKNARRRGRVRHLRPKPQALETDYHHDLAI